MATDLLVGKINVRIGVCLYSKQMDWAFEDSSINEIFINI